MVSKVLWVGLNPSSSASVPKIREPPRLGVAEEIPSGWVPPLDEPEPEPEPELQAARRPPEVPTMARPAPVAALRARKERRSIRSVMVPLRTVAWAHRLRHA